MAALWPPCWFLYVSLDHVNFLRSSLESSLSKNCARTWSVKFVISKRWRNTDNIGKIKQRVTEHACIYLEPFVLYLIDIPTWYRAQGILTRFPWPFPDLFGCPEKRRKKKRNGEWTPRRRNSRGEIGSTPVYVTCLNFLQACHVSVSITAAIVLVVLFFIFAIPSIKTFWKTTRDMLFQSYLELQRLFSFGEHIVLLEKKHG